MSEAELLRQALDAAGAEAAAEAGPSRRLWPWLASLGSLAALGAVLKAGQKYRPTEYGRALGGLL